MGGLPVVRGGLIICAFWLALAALIGVSGTAYGETAARETLQQRFAVKEGRPFFHLAGATLIRDDFYHSLGYGLDAGYFPRESIGLELRLLHMRSRLSAEGQRMREEFDVVPDLRAPQALATVGARISTGYGKVLTPGDYVVHFDPQIVAHVGAMLAERRVVPTATIGLGLLTHWRRGVQVKLDLQMMINGESRNRGWVLATGFFPVLSVGWSPMIGGSQ